MEWLDAYLLAGCSAGTLEEDTALPSCAAADMIRIMKFIFDTFEALPI